MLSEGQVIFTQLIDHVKPPNSHAIQTLILVHRRELVEQAARHCTNAYPGKTIDIEMGNTHSTGAADITIASVRSLTSGNRMTKFNPQCFKLILVDEAHHIVASSYMEVLKYFGVVPSQSQHYSPALVGVSATLSRFDGLRLSDAIDHVVYHKDYVDMIGEKWLSDVIFTTVQSKADVSRVKKAATGDFQTKDLSKAVNTQQTNDITVRAWLSCANNRKSTLVFCVDIAHLSGLTEEFRKHGIDARSITGDTAKVKRSERLDAFRNGEYPVLLNCGVFTEGTDIPNIDCVLLARPTRSRNLLVQMIGRGMRQHSGKANCHIVDMVASLEAGIVSTPTLFGLDPGELIKEANLEDLRRLKERQTDQSAFSGIGSVKSTTESPGTVSFTHYDSVWDLIDDTSGERHIRSMSQLSWVQTSKDRYVLAPQSGDYLTTERHPQKAELFRVIYTERLRMIPDEEGKKPRAPYKRPREIAQGASFADVVRSADTFALSRYPRHLITHKMPWRQQPATDGQLSFLNNFRDTDEKLAGDMITKGKAGDMITKIKFGARGRFKDVVSSEKIIQRKMNRSAHLERLKEREKVRVGPLDGSYV
ncbi:MAG: hypothetical protein HETSPECPRED_009257 [Heterodermia speciosa]|uniref:Uncharacterized protein n=1 Tax=Heterodermia speciosa TaxID=116794 RepID=A0A8H3FYA8_9LECA|nr:MAG: hypothetical protein HETSPECPRED_009257 [Heterodermia speciosa]